MPSRRQPDLDPLPRRRAVIAGAWGKRRARETDPPDVTTEPGAWPIDQLGATGAAGAAVWESALERASGDPRARPLSVIRLAIDAPTLTADDAEELQRLLAITSVAWREILRPGDTLAQLGETDFGVLLPRCDAAATARIAGRLDRAVPEALRSRLGTSTANTERGLRRLAERADQALQATRSRRDPITDPGRLSAVTAAGPGLTVPRQPAIDRLARGAAELIDAAAVLITVVDASHQHFVGAHGTDTFGVPTDGLPVSGAVGGAVMSSARPHLVTDSQRHGVAELTATERAFGIRACASVPLTAPSGAVLGVVCAWQPFRHEWSDDALTVLRVTAERAAARLLGAPSAAPTDLAGAPST